VKGMRRGRGGNSLCHCRQRRGKEGRIWREEQFDSITNRGGACTIGCFRRKRGRSLIGGNLREEKKKERKKNKWDMSFRGLGVGGGGGGKSLEESQGKVREREKPLGFITVGSRNTRTDSLIERGRLGGGGVKLLGRKRR